MREGDEGFRGVRDSQRYHMPDNGYLRHSVPTDYWTNQPGAAASLPRTRRNTWRNRSRVLNSWQARNYWYSGVAIILSAGALVGIFAMIMALAIVQ